MNKNDISLTSLKSASRTLVDALSRTLNDLERDGVIQRFEYTFELSWKTMKDYLIYNGVQVSLPREVIKQAFHHQLIRDGQVWIDMLEDRNLMAHVYQEQAALIAGKSIRERYAPAIEQIHNDLLKKRKA